MKTLGTMLILIATLLIAPAAHADEADLSTLTKAERHLIEVYDRAHPALALAPRCYNTWTADDARMNFDTGPFSDRWVDVRNKVIFKQCRYNRGRGDRFVDPISYTFGYNIEGSGISCGWPNDFDQINFHIYLWDGAGRNHDKSGMLGCHEDTTDETTRSLLDAPRMTYCSTHPKWRMNVDGIFRSQPNDHATLRNALWHGMGPFPSTC